MLRDAAENVVAFGGRVSALIGVLTAMPLYFVAAAIGSFLSVLWLGLIAGWRS